MTDESTVCVLIPTLNEEATIADVIDGFLSRGYTNILVMDGGSTDDTVDIAAERGVTVRTQSDSGKGQAVVEAMEYIDSDIVLMVDGDGTYRPEDADQLVAPIKRGRADHVIGNRFHDMESGAMSSLNRFGNRQINRLFAFINQQTFHDILTGYRAFDASAFHDLNLSASGFGIEAEMTSEAVRRGQTIEEVPITYLRRPAASQSKLRPIRDGAVIFSTLYRIARMNNPMFFFGVLGAIAMLAGGLLAGYVGYRWYFVGVNHNVLAIVSSFLIIFGFQLVMFGVLSDMIVRLHREQRNRIRDLRDQFGGDD